MWQGYLKKMQKEVDCMLVPGMIGCHMHPGSRMKCLLQVRLKS